MNGDYLWSFYTICFWILWQLFQMFGGFMNENLIANNQNFAIY